MNKSQLVETVANKSKLSKATVAAVLDTLSKTIKTASSKGDDVKITGLGTFTKQKYKARIRRNPQTGQMMQMPAVWRPKFKATKAYKDLVK